MRATHEIQASSSRFGRCRSQAARPPSRPAGSPPTSPHIITGPAAGTASRLAGRDESGIPPNTGISTGATPTCAAMVTASVGGTRRRSRAGPTRAMPAQAPAESRKPTEPASIGSSSTSPVTAKASTRTELTGRPRAVAVMASAAMATARSTDGSHRVNAPKVISTTTPATSRPRSPRRRSIGAATANTKATFCPETASRWVRPEARKSSTSTGSCSRSSPRTRPVNRARRAGDIDPVPARSVRRSWLVKRATGPPGPIAVASVTVSRLPMWRRAR